MKRALLSVWDKRGLVPLAHRLKENGWQLIASGGTALALNEAEIEVIPVRDLTGEPELFGGRVKTLHPAIHAGILAPDTEAARDQLHARGWGLIDLVVVNLYPFQDVIKNPQTSHSQAIEHIDIGGVALLRAAAKNYQRVITLCDPDDYPTDLSHLEGESFREKMAFKTFATTAAYDDAIADYFSERCGFPQPTKHLLYPVQQLRYGENPHQRATFYASKPGGSPFQGQLLQGKPLSYNNLLDLDGAWRTVQCFERPAAVVVKHASPCGVAEANQVEDALPLALESDPVSAFGSVIASNYPISEAFVDKLGDLFLECLVAPDFTKGALQKLARNQNLRLVQVPLDQMFPLKELRSISGGFLEQDTDQGDPEGSPNWEVMTERQPTPLEMDTLRFAWKAVMDVKSNAVLLARTENNTHFTVGIGGGQPNRIDSLRIAGWRAEDRAGGSVLASDAFFPFPDGIRLAADLGVIALVQPGGSIKDQEVIDEANRLKLTMLFTGIRHFRH